MQKPLCLPEVDGRLDPKQQALVKHLLTGCLKQDEASRLSWEELFKVMKDSLPQSGIRLKQSVRSSFSQSDSELKDLEDQRVSLNNQ